MACSLDMTASRTLPLTHYNKMEWEMREHLLQKVLCIYVWLACIHARTHMYTRMHTHIKSKKKSKATSCRLAVTREAMGCLGTNQALWASAGKSTWERASTPQVGMPRVMVWAPKVPYPLVGMDSSLTFASPVITRYPLMLQLGGLLP